MDGTFGGGDLISASLAIMLGGEGDAELHDKEVSLSTSQITGSQTAIFEYDPADEDPQGTPPGPWDGYSLFTVDLSDVKEDIEDLQQQISDLEDELEACHDCKDAVVAAMQVIDPNYVLPASGCPDDIPPKAYQKGQESVTPALGSKFITQNGTYYASGDNLDGYDTVIVDVQTWESCIQQIATKLGLTDPYDCNDIIDAVEDYHGIDVPAGVDPGPIAVQLGANTQAQATIDGKTISVSLAGYGYYSVTDEHYTSVENDDPITEYFSYISLYSAYDEAPAPTSAYTYRTYMYAVTLEGYPTVYTFNAASNNTIDDSFYVNGVTASGNTLIIDARRGSMGIIYAADGKTFATDGTVKIV